MSPLQSCINLELLGLGTNRLKSIDIEPLKKCENLKVLYLFDNRFKTIDLTTLRSFSNLEELYLYRNDLQEIDLAPLSSCPELKILQLQTNHLQTIDLAPLNSCTGLEELNLSRNMITGIDLNPLSACTQLEQFGLSDNKILAMDLSPFVFCEELSVIYLDGNRFQKLDLTPLGLSPRIARGSFEINFKVSSSVQWLETLYSETNFRSLPNEITVSLQYDIPVFSKDIKVITQILDSVIENEPGWKTIHLLHNMLSLLDLRWLGMMDVDAGPFLTELLRIQSEYGQDAVIKRILAQVSTQIDLGLTTIGLDVKRMAEYPELANKFDKVTDLRKGEIEQVEVMNTDLGLDLRSLWLTAYGFLVLNALDLGTHCGSDDIEMVQQALSDMDSELRITNSETIQHVTELSPGLREYIWHLADYKSELRRLGFEKEFS